VIFDQLVLDWAHVALMTLALGVLVQELGMLSLGHTGIALAAAYLAAAVALGILPVIPGVLIGCGLVATIACFALRLRDDIFAVVTLALSEGLRHFFIGAGSLTGGALGLGPVGRPDWLATTAMAATVAWAVFLGLALVVVPLMKGWTGLALGAIRDGELFARAAGIRARRLRLIAVGATATVAAVSGMLQVGYYGLASPSAGSLDITLQAIAAVMIGWRFWRQGRPFRNLLGYAFGAAVVVILPALLRQVGAEVALAGVMRQCVFGAMLFCLVHPRFRAAGLFRQ